MVKAVMLDETCLDEAFQLRLDCCSARPPDGDMFPGFRNDGKERD